MSQANYILVRGFVCREPKLRVTPQNLRVTNLRVGSAPRILDRETGEWRDGEVTYFDVTCWRKLAENVSYCVRKGDMVTIHGKFKATTWTDKDQLPHVRLEVTADTVAHDMAYGWSHFNRSGGQSRIEDELATGEMNRQELSPGDQDGWTGSLSPEVAPVAETPTPGDLETPGEPETAGERELEDAPF